MNRFFLSLVWLKSLDPCTAPSRPTHPTIWYTVRWGYRGVGEVQLGTRQILMLQFFWFFWVCFICESIQRQCFSVNEGSRQGVIVSYWSTTIQTKGLAAGKWTGTFSCQAFNKQLTSTSTVLLMNYIYGSHEKTWRDIMQIQSHSTISCVCIRIKAKEWLIKKKRDELIVILSCGPIPHKCSFCEYQTRWISLPMINVTWVNRIRILGQLNHSRHDVSIKTISEVCCASVTIFYEHLK